MDLSFLQDDSMWITQVFVVIVVALFLDFFQRRFARWYDIYDVILKSSEYFLDMQSNDLFVFDDHYTRLAALRLAAHFGIHYAHSTIVDTTAPNAPELVTQRCKTYTINSISQYIRLLWLLDFTGL